VDKPPQSWRAPQRAKWDKLDPDVRQEIMRRERETTKVLGETATARQMSNEFTQVVSPYQARIQSMGVTPMVAAHELFKADYILSTAPKGQRAQFMAKLINDYGIDIVELDNALSGRPVADPVDARVEALLAQRMKPLEQFLTAQQQAQVQAQQRSAQEVNQTVEQMSVDPKYPHFEAVRHDMADVIEISAKRGVYLTPEQAYNRAIAMNPEVSAQVATAQAAEAKRKTALEANSRAQRALNASTSVGGAPGGVPGGASEATDRRSAIAAAFDSIGR
jgi:DNA-binding ferritin-like protein